MTGKRAQGTFQSGRNVLNRDLGDGSVGAHTCKNSSCCEDIHCTFARLQSKYVYIFLHLCKNLGAFPLAKRASSVFSIFLPTLPSSLRLTLSTHPSHSGLLARPHTPTSRPLHLLFP